MTGSKGKDVFNPGPTTPQGNAPLPSEAAQQGKKTQSQIDEETSKLFVEERRQRRFKKGVIGLVLLVLAVVSLFVDEGYTALFDPGEVFACYGVCLNDMLSSVTGSSVMGTDELLRQHPAYFRIINRVNITCMTLLCGAALAVAGTLYQSAFKNPIASPSMLGVSSAIQLGNVIMVVIFGTAAANFLGYRYLICYLCVIVVTVVLFGLARLMTGKGRPINVVNLLLVATILTQFIGVVVTYVTYYLFDNELWEVYNNLNEGVSPDLNLISWTILIATCVVGLVPIIVLRFRINGLNFADSDMRMLGIDSGKLRLIALLCGTILLMGAQVQMGTIAMLSLVVPHISRMVFGAEFRKQFAGNVMMGAALLILCRIVTGFIPVLGPILPISTVLNFVVLPFFVWMLASQQRGWEQ